MEQRQGDRLSTMSKHPDVWIQFNGMTKKFAKLSTNHKQTATLLTTTRLVI